MIRRGIMLKLAAVLFAAAVIYLWEIAADARLISPVFFPSPTRTFAAFLAMKMMCLAISAGGDKICPALAESVCWRVRPGSSRFQHN